MDPILCVKLIRGVTVSGCAALMALALTGVNACGPPPPPPDEPDVTVVEPVRPYAVAARAEGYRVGEVRPRVFDMGAVEVLMPPPPAAVAEDEETADAGGAEEWVTGIPLDALVVPVDLLGVPWSSFDGPGDEPTDLPEAWRSALTSMLETARDSGLPLVVALTPLSESWDTLAAQPEQDTSPLGLDPLWKPYCFDPSLDGDPTRYRDAYGAFAAWMAEESQADWLILGQRMNLYEENCGASAYAALAGFTTEAHQRVTALNNAPRTVVSVDVEDLYGFPRKAGRCEQASPEACLAERGALLEDLEADYLGLESYPAWAVADGQDWDAAWLSRVSEQRPDLPAVISGTGFPSREIFSKQGSCVPLLESSEQEQLLWLDRVLATASAEAMELVVWTWLTEPADGAAVSGCSCSEPPELCAHLSGLGPAADPFRIRMNSGLWGVDGSPRQSATIWTQMVTP